MSEHNVYTWHTCIEPDQDRCVSSKIPPQAVTRLTLHWPSQFLFILPSELSNIFSLLRQIFFSQLCQIFWYRQEDNWTCEWICWSKMVTQKWYQPINRMVSLLKHLHPIMLVFKDIFKWKLMIIESLSRLKRSSELDTELNKPC